jgi:hypothetical protein
MKDTASQKYRVPQKKCRQMGGDTLTGVAANRHRLSQNSEARMEWNRQQDFKGSLVPLSA